MTSSNGANHSNVEDILASIRTSISDETSPFRPGAAVPLRREAVAEEPPEFELPAIFKPGSQQAPQRGNLFGRLSSAVTGKEPGAEPQPERSRTVIRFEPVGGNRPAEPVARVQAQPQPNRAQSFPQLGPQPHSAPPVRPVAAPQPASFQVAQASQNSATRPVGSSDVAAKVMQENAEVKREMPSFFDTRMKRMSSTGAPAPAEPKPAEAAAPAVPQPPPLMPDLGGTAEDAAAQLLRPILKEWLSENMHKIVERALREDGPEPPQPPVRKTLR